jgi:putative transposase
MPRKPIERSHENYYHITARSNNREFFYLSILNVWDIMTEKLAKLQSDHRIKIGAFVLMDNHFHLLILTPFKDIDRIMYIFMKEVTLDIQKCSGRINKIFGGRYKGSMITGYDHLINVYKYIYRNPVEVSLTNRAELYPYSTLFYKTHPYIRCSFKLETILLAQAFDSYYELDELLWINQKFEKCEADSVSSGLQKTIFAYKKDKINNRPIEPVVRHPKKITKDKL